MVVADDLVRDFLGEMAEHLDVVEAELARLAAEPADAIRVILRHIHTIRGTSGFFDLPRLGTLLGALESCLVRIRAGAPASDGTRRLVADSIARVRAIAAGIERTGTETPGTDSDLTGPLASGRPRKDGPRGQAAEPRIPDRTGMQSAMSRARARRQAAMIRLADELDDVGEALRRLSQIQDAAEPAARLAAAAETLRGIVAEARLQPIGAAWAKLPRLVRDIATETGKRMNLVASGGEIEIDLRVIEAIRDPLTHIVRNAAHHGIEDPATRAAADKPACGTIRLAASLGAGTLTIDVSDDGAGLDLTAIRRRAVELGLDDREARGPVDERILADLVFDPGFSTSPAICPLAGLGVGLDVARANVQALGGTVAAASLAGRGATFTLRIPLVADPMRHRGGDMHLPALLLVGCRGPARDGIADLAGRSGFRLRTAETVAEALGHLTGGGIGAMLVAPDLPDGPALALFEALRGDPCLPRIPAALLGEPGEPTEAARLRALGIDTLWTLFSYARRGSDAIHSRIAA